MTGDYDEKELCYLAGFFDGEGCVCLYRNGSNFVLDIQVSQVKLEVLNIYKSFFGGIIIKKQNAPPTHQDCYKWRIVGKDAEKFLIAITPYLKQKKEKAELAIKFREIGRKSNLINLVSTKDHIRENAIIHNNIIDAKREAMFCSFKLAS